MGFLKDFGKSWEKGGWYTSKGRRVMRGKSAGYESAQEVMDRRQTQIQEYLDRTGGMDEFGIPRGNEVPPHEIAPQLQFQAERMTYERNRRLEGDADAAVQSAQGLLESYRPGGAAALASGIHARRADVLLNSRAEAPDLLFEWRTNQDRKARKAAREASYMNLAGTVLAVAGSVVGGPLVGAAIGAGVAAAGAKGQQPAGGTYRKGDVTPFGGPRPNSGPTSPTGMTGPSGSEIPPLPGGPGGVAQAQMAGPGGPQAQGPQPAQREDGQPGGGPSGGGGGGGPMGGGDPGTPGDPALDGGGGMGGPAPAMVPFAPTGGEVASPLHPASMAGHMAARYGPDAMRQLSTRAYMTEFAGDPFWDGFFADIEVLDTQVSQLMNS